jgi:hypothetical protein
MPLVGLGFQSLSEDDDESGSHAAFLSQGALAKSTLCQGDLLYAPLHGQPPDTL